MDKIPKYISQEQQELFEKYLMGEMPVEEQLLFKARLADDENLQKAFEEFKALFDIVEEAGLRERMQDFHKTFAPNDKEDNGSKWLFPITFNYRIAASIAILLAVGGIWYFGGQDTNEKLFETYFSPDPGLPTVMGNSENYAFYEAMVDYKQGNYEAAIGKWEELLIAQPENDSLNYFLGVAHLANKNGEKALVFLQKINNNTESEFSDDAILYLGMANLYLGNIEEAKAYLSINNTPLSRDIISELPQ